MERKNLWIIALVAIITIGIIGCGGNDTGVEEFTVTFDLDGGNISGNTNSVQIKVKSGETISNLPSPQKIENTTGFGGWYTQKYGIGNEFTVTTTISSDLTVFAKWENPFVGKWINDSKNEWKWDFFADLTWLLTDNNVNWLKGTYSFTTTVFTRTYTHVWNDSSWMDLDFTEDWEYVINNNQITIEQNGTWTKQN